MPRSSAKNIFILHLLLHSKPTTTTTTSLLLLLLHLLRHLDIDLKELRHTTIQAHTLPLIQFCLAVIGGYAFLDTGLR